ncbi:MAG: phosphatase PAP2 family protein [Oscillospiraceae bacterium]|jgi:undecaprenyl-diphosphatase|nr:phosphatase PAP2 family protein [Oscillospiraceae bacterium]
MVTIFDGLLRLDGDIVLAVQERLRCGALDRVMAALSLMGNAGAVWLLLCAALMSQKRYRRRGLLLLVCLAVCFIVNNVVIKNIVARPRPFDAIDGLRIIVSAPFGHSFPSGHAASGFASAYCALKTLRRRAVACAYALASLIALSRVYVGVHYPGDIIAGAVFGTLCAAAVFCAAARVRRIVASISRAGRSAAE